MKKGAIPFIKISNSYLYPHSKVIKDSRIDLGGEVVDIKHEFTFLDKELKLFFKMYEVRELEYLDYAEFPSLKGMFDDYIDKWYGNKLNCGKDKALKTISKLFLVALYGKFATSEESTFKVPFICEKENFLMFDEIKEYEAKAGYIAVGSQIISEGRVFEIETVYKNKDAFIAGDTDSLMLEGELENLKGIEIGDKLGEFKVERVWDSALFLKEKRYITEVECSEKKDVEIKYSGMPELCKKLLLKSMGCDIEINEIITDEMKEFIEKKRNIRDLMNKICIPGNLTRKRVPGGIILERSEFTMNGKI